MTGALKKPEVVIPAAALTGGLLAPAAVGVPAGFAAGAEVAAGAAVGAGAGAVASKAARKSKGKGKAAAPSVLKPSPLAEPLLMSEVESAKKSPRRRKRGRGANILAGRMMQSRQILNTRLGE
jgi:hypothetical protein